MMHFCFKKKSLGKMHYVDKLDLTESDDPEWCNYVDCLEKEAVKSCRTTCSEPKWCKLADCSIAPSIKSCKKSCKIKGAHYNHYVPNLLPFLYSVKLSFFLFIFLK